MVLVVILEPAWSAHKVQVLEIVEIGLYDAQMFLVVHIIHGVGISLSQKIVIPDFIPRKKTHLFEERDCFFK